LWRAASEVVSRLLSDVGANGNKWSNLIERFSNLPREEQSAIVEKLSTLNVEEFTADDRLKLWSTLRETISHHREYQDAEWAMPAELSGELEELYGRFTPEDIVTQNAWLFSFKAKLVKPATYKKDDFHAFHEKNRI